MSDPSANVNSYVGRCKCGALAAAVVDIPGQEKETSKAVAEFIRDSAAEERGMAGRDEGTVKFYFSLTAEQAVLVRGALGEDLADGLYRLCAEVGRA